VDPTEFQAMVDCEERHWWYRGRRSIVRTQLERLPHDADLKLLDAGCGSGRMLDELGNHASVSGLDSSPDAVALAKARGHRRVSLGRVEDMPYEDGSFDVVTCLDVIEHTADDIRSLSELRRVTRVGGYLLVTVPAYGFLWSTHDVVNQHYRRYGRSALRAAATAAGWEVERDTYFNSILLPPAALVRLMRRSTGTEGERSDLTLTPRWLDRALAIPLRLEAALLRRGGRLPVGLSLLALLRNPGELQRSHNSKDDPGRPAPPRPARAASREMPRQFAKFIVVGMSNTLISLVAYVLALKAGVPYLLASVAAFTLGALNGYSLNRVWTFRAGAFAPSGLLRYAVVQALGLIANAGLLAGLVEGTRLDRIVAQALVLPIVSVLTFALNRRWAFRGARSRGVLAPAANPDSGTG
jgi:putative flippase GtrA/SAM-dependent methyltransferase